MGVREQMQVQVLYAITQKIEKNQENKSLKF
jgi:hypothetical protein